MSTKNKKISYSDGWAMYEACMSYNNGEITIDQLDMVYFSANGNFILPDVRKRIINAKELHDALQKLPVLKDKPKDQ